MRPFVKEPTASGMAIRTAIILFVFVVGFTGLLSGAYLWTRPALEASAAEERMKLIDEVLPRSLYDNELLQDMLQLPPTPALGLDQPSTAYRARQGSRVSAIVLEAVAPDGYAGKIRLIMAINAQGALTGVRVTQHKETPGLGDYIEPKKDKNKAQPWIGQFTGLSLMTVSARDWKVRKDGGRFDTRAGATITPRAVIKAVHKAMLYVANNRESLFATGQP